MRPRARLALLAALSMAAVLFADPPGAQESPPAQASPPAQEDDLQAALHLAAPALHAEALEAALRSWNDLSASGAVTRPILAVIDYALPSTAKRLWVFDLGARSVLYEEMVAHGKNSGEDATEFFSNDEGSLMSSLGAFVTGTTYVGRNGYSLRLRGMDAGVNDHAEARAIVMHGAPYVDEAVIEKLGRLGRSHGCPALRPAIARELIDSIKDGALLYAWHP